MNVREHLIALEAWAMDDESLILSLIKCLAIFATVLILLIAPFAIFSGPSAESLCLNNGGAWMRSGSHLGAKGQTVYEYDCIQVPR